ncbi:MAG: DUF4325 domain-containing protein [Candidatus Omnitrophota bacterium]
MNISKLIIQLLEKKKEIRVSDIVKLTGFSRAYINRFFSGLREEGKILLLGKANQAKYILACDVEIKHAKKTLLTVHRILNNKSLSEDIILNSIKEATGIFSDIPENIGDILSYAFTEMLNNAIEHSGSKNIDLTMQNDKKEVRFSILDRGVGIFNNIMNKKGLHNELEAIQDLTKGKLSTMPESHSGEGIFFTSKAASILKIQSFTKDLIFDNIAQDIFVSDRRRFIGTKVVFSIRLDSKEKLEDIFRAYTDDSFQFSRTRVTVKLYKMGSEHISRSQARRILVGLDRFKEITLDFKDVKTVGQAFADEIYRVWKTNNPKINIIHKNANENIGFMIDRARSKFSLP